MKLKVGSCLQNLLMKKTYNGLFDNKTYLTPGSVNAVDLYDAIKISKYMIGKVNLTEEELKNVDVSNDGKVDLYDVIKISKSLLSK